MPDKRGMEYVFQYQTAKINDSDYQQNIDESSEKIVTCMLENTVQVGRLFDTTCRKNVRICRLMI